MDFSFKNIDIAYSQIQNNVIRTPLVSSEYINKELRSNIFFKLENLQITGSFKFRGAFFKISLLTNEEKSRGVVAYSSGNHAQAVAYASNILGINAKIVIIKMDSCLLIE